jgi:HAD superfamily hydrolase (TIGR01509 family)
VNTSESLPSSAELRDAESSLSWGTPRAAVFDFDGLMFNTEELYHEVGGELLARRGHQLTRELLNQMMGRPSPVALGIMIEFHGLNDSVAGLQRETEEIFLKLLPGRLAPMPGLLELLDHLESLGIPKAIATSSRRPFLDRCFRQFPLAERFQFILTCEDVTHGKPHPEMYLKASARFDLNPREVVVFEDSQNGCRAAVAAGARVVAVPGDHSRHHDFTGAALIADTLADPRLYDVLAVAPAQSALRTTQPIREQELAATGQILAVCISAGGIPKLPQQAGMIVASGLEGDQHNHEKHRRLDRALSLLDLELIEQLQAEGYRVEPGALGENLTLTGVNVQALSPGTRLAIGEVLIKLEQPRKPCYVLDPIDPKLKDVLVGRCGFMASVERGGKIEPGMAVRVISSDQQ